MLLNFPYPANLGQIYIAQNGVSYVYDGVKWVIAPLSSTGNLILSNNIISSNNLGNIVIDSNGYFWTFDNTGGLIFPDNSVQTTAGGGNVTISQLINGSHNFSLDSSGSITAQGNIRIPLTSYIDFANSDTNWRMGYNLHGYSKTTAQSTIDIEVGAGSAGPDGFTIGNSNGQSIFELRGDTRDAWFAHDLTVSNNLTSHLANIVSLNVAQINGTNSGDYLAIQTANFYAWQFGADGTLNLPAANNGNAVIQSPATIELNSNNQIWFFNNNGTLTFPDGSIQPTAFLNNAIINANGENLNPGNPFFIQSSDTVSMGTFAAQSISAGPSGIQLVSTGGVSLQGAAYASVTLGGGTTGDVLVNIGSNQWTFNSSGLTFPDNTVQTTAYTGGGGGNPFDQSLNTTDNVTFNKVATNNLDFGQETIGLPMTGGVNDRITLFNFDNPSQMNYAIGVEQNYIWFATDLVSSQGGFKFYGGTTEALSITGDGVLHLAPGGNIVDSNGNSVLGVGSFGTDLGISPAYNTNDPAILFSNDDLLIRTGGTAATGSQNFGAMFLAASEQAYFGQADNLVDATYVTYNTCIEATNTSITLTVPGHTLILADDGTLKLDGTNITGGGNPFNQSLNTYDNVEFQQAVAAQFLAAGGVPTYGDTATFGYSFQSDTGFDSGMFSVADGHVNIFTNGRSAAEFTDQDIYITTNNSDYSGVNEWHFDRYAVLTTPGDIQVSGNVQAYSQTLISGDNSTGTFGYNQMIFGFDGTTDWTHFLRTRHNADDYAGNAFDFYTNANQQSGPNPPIHGLTIQSGSIGVGGNTNPQYTIDADGTVAGNAFLVKNDGSITYDALGSEISEARPGQSINFYGVPTIAVTGSGSGCTLNVFYNAGSTSYSVNVNDGGSYTYYVGDQLKVTGDLLGGTTPANDLIVQVSQLYFNHAPPFAVIEVTIVSGTPVTYPDGLHVRQNGLEWTFGEDGLLHIASGGVKFRDQTTQTTAWPGYVSELQNNEYVVSLDVDGALNLANNGVIRNQAAVNVVSTNYSQLQWVDTVQNMLLIDPNSTPGLTNMIWAESGGVLIHTNINGSGGSKEWQFDNDGMLNLPASIGDIKRDGVSVLGVKYSSVGDASYGDFTVTTEQLVLCNPNGTAQTITLPANPIAGQTVTIKKCSQFTSAGYVITIQGNGYNIDSTSSIQINSGFGFVTLVYGFNGRVGTQWWVLDSSL